MSSKAPHSSSLADTAAAWLARRDAGFLPDEERAFSAWCAADPRHAAAVAQLENSWSALDRPLQAGMEDEVIEKLSAYANERRKRRRSGVIAVAMMLLIAGGMTWWSVDRSMDPPARQRAVVLSPAQETLVDGSLVELKTGAQIAVQFTPKVRRVLLRGGEAHFQVTKDPNRPFVVVAGQLEVRAVGTGFLVQLSRETVEVLVTEGKVAVEVAGPDRVELSSAVVPEKRPALALEAGHRTVLDRSAEQLTMPQVVSVSAPEMAERLGWRTRRFEFTGAPLSEAVALLNRYNDVQFVIADTTLANECISGIFRADNVEGFVHMLASGLPVVIERSEKRILVRWRD